LVEGLRVTMFGIGTSNIAALRGSDRLIRS